MASPGRNERLALQAECDSSHKTDCTDRDQQGTAGDAVKSSSWNPAQPSNPGTPSGSIFAEENFWAGQELFRGFVMQRKNAPANRGVWVFLRVENLRTLRVDLGVVALGVPLVDDVVDHL